ncbi:MAG: TonB-dependent receptor plug domain-containing protein [Opitutae bacterium]|nr:TonB-dependent receptor plug domain-containing protein [Opitutae bacterium]
MNTLFAKPLAHPFVLLALGTAWTAASVLAQTPASTPPPKDDSIVLSVFEVTTSKDVGYQSSNAAEATRMNTPIEDIPMNVTIYNQQMIEDLLATDTSQLLAFEASAVKTTENDGFMSRGFASVGTSFVNGFAQTTGFGAQPLANIERVEVLQGPAAVLFGSGGYGATFNRITKQPRPNRFTNFRTIMSDDHGYRVELDHNTGALPYFGGEKLSFRINGAVERSTTWSGLRKGEDAIAPSLAWNIGPKTKVVLEYIYHWQDTQAGWETPMHAGQSGFVTGDGTYRVTPRRTNWVIPEDFRHNTRQTLSSDFRHAFSDKFQFRSQIQYETRAQMIQETMATGNLTTLLDTILVGLSWRQVPRITRTYRTRDEFIWQFKTGPVSHRVLFGYGWQQQYDRNTTYRSAVSGAQASYKITYAQFLANPALGGYTMPKPGERPLLIPINLFDRGVEPPVPAIADRAPAVLNADAQSYTSNQDFYVNDVFSFARDRVFVVAGVRHTDFQRKNITWNSGATLKLSAPTAYSVDDATTTSIGATWHLNAAKTLSLYGNMNTSFAPQYNVQPDGTKLDNEAGKQKEIGLRFSLFQGRIQSLFSYFDILQDNVTSADPAPGRTGYYIQKSGQRSTGFECKVNARITDSWSIMGSGADIDARNDITGEAKDLQPQYRFAVINTYNFKKGTLKGLRLTLAQRFQGERPLTNSTARGETDWGPLPAYWNHDIVIGYKYRFAKSRYTWDFLFKVSNILDNTDQYYVAAYHRFTIDAGRTWQGVASVRF